MIDWLIENALPRDTLVYYKSVLELQLTGASWIRALPDTYLCYEWWPKCKLFMCYYDQKFHLPFSFRF